MSEVIEYSGRIVGGQRVLDGPVCQLLLSAMCDAASPGSGAAEWEAFKSTPGTLAVELKINGVECQFSTVVERLQAVAKGWAEREAAKLVRERAGPLDHAAERLAKIDDMLRDMERAFTREATELFPEYREDWE